MRIIKFSIHGYYFSTDEIWSGWYDHNSFSNMFIDLTIDYSFTCTKWVLPMPDVDNNVCVVPIVYSVWEVS